MNLEEINDQADRIIKEMNKMLGLVDKQGLITQLEGMKKDFLCDDGTFENDAPGYNQALEDVIELLTKQQ